MQDAAFTDNSLSPVSRLEQVWILLSLVFALFFPPFILIAFARPLSLRSRLFLSGTLGLVIFLVWVAIPFYFQGYSALEHPSAGKAFGLPAIPVLGNYSYLLSISEIGFVWLLGGLCQVCFGECPGRRSIGSFVRFVVCAGFAVCLFEFHRYSATLNVVLE